MGIHRVQAAGTAGRDKWDHKGYTKIAQIIVSSGPFSLYSLQFQYLVSGRLVTSEIIGCTDFSGPNFQTFVFRDPSEFITGVAVHTKCGAIGKLCIYTNIKEYVIFQEEGLQLRDTKRFCFSFGGEDQFGGFHGTHNCRSVSSFGVYFKPMTAPPAGLIPDFDDGYIED